MTGFRMTPGDEFMHRPDASPNFNESVYVNGFDAATGLGGWMRLGNRANEGYAELSVCLYLPDGRIACQFARPRIADNARFDAGGLRYDVLEPLRKVAMSYEGELLLLDHPDLLREPDRMFREATRVVGAVRLEHEAASPVHGGEPENAQAPTMYGRDFSLGHFNQHTRVRGALRFGAQDLPIDGHGWRDHSWGPRTWQNIHFYRLFLANLGDGRGFMLLRIADASGRSRRLGVLLVDGDYEEVVDFDLRTEWTARQDPARVWLGVRTARRTETIEGEVLSLAPLRNRREIGGRMVVSRIAEGFTRFAWSGGAGYGMTEYIERIENGRLIGYPL